MRDASYFTPLCRTIHTISRSAVPPRVHQLRSAAGTCLFPPPPHSIPKPCRLRRNHLASLQYKPCEPANANHTALPTSLTDCRPARVRIRTLPLPTSARSERLCARHASKLPTPPLPLPQGAVAVPRTGRHAQCRHDARHQRRQRDAALDESGPHSHPTAGAVARSAWAMPCTAYLGSTTANTASAAMPQSLPLRLILM